MRAHPAIHDIASTAALQQRSAAQARARTPEIPDSGAETAHGSPDEWSLAISQMREQMPLCRLHTDASDQGDISMKLHQTIAAAAVASTVLLGAAGAAFAQSQQGGYLGLNPGGHLTAAGPVVPEHGSGQGGYLGLNPGAHLTAAGPAQPEHGSGEGGYLGMVPGGNPPAAGSHG
jgi:hypothetical protein